MLFNAVLFGFTVMLNNLESDKGNQINVEHILIKV